PIINQTKHKEVFFPQLLLSNKKSTIPIPVYPMGFKSTKIAGTNLLKRIHSRSQKLSNIKKNRFLIGSGIQCGD
ncbi:MAG: hypothetical protein IJ337_03075, partial [Clostridia bacterium]|nr:hypothetical protein [Clostridia bacterium]